MTVADVIEARLRVRDRYAQVLSDYDRSETRTRELRAIAVHDCELTALIEGNLEAKALMQMRTLQIGMLLLREPSSGNASAFEQMLQSARGRGATASVDTQPAPPTLLEPAPPAAKACPPPLPTGAQAALLSIVPKGRIQRDDPPDASVFEARSVLTTYAKTDRHRGVSVPDVVLSACRQLVARGTPISEVCKLADLSRMALNRYGIRARPQ